MKSIADAREAIINSHPDSAVYIGCDSIRCKRHGRWVARYAIVIVLHHASSKGASVFYDIEVHPDDAGSLRQRLMKEVELATLTALGVVDVLGDRSMEIHIDVNTNPKHKSNIVKNEAVGYVMGQLGFPPKLKPSGWAATHAADACARGRLERH